LSQFHQEATKRKIGTGLGLWITKELTGKMDGEIKVFSQENQGTTFVVALKCRVAKSINEIQNPDNQKLTALVVDDVKDNRDTLKSLLEKCGVQVTDMAENGLVAVNIYKERGPKFFNFVFMDLEMPILNGKLASIKIREIEAKNKWDPVNLVILTGLYGYQPQIENSAREEMKVDYFFVKPFSLTQCKSVLETYRKKKSATINLTSPELERKWRGFKVLVVDDDYFNRKIIGDYLENYKISYLFANNGIEAINQIKHNANVLKLIFMDGEMPLLNGFEASKQIQSLLKANQLSPITIYGVSGNEGQAYVKKALESEMTGLLVKPVSFAKLKEILSNVKI